MMNKMPNDNPPPLAMRLILDRIDGIESAIAASIDRFADAVRADLLSAEEPNAGHRKTKHEVPPPYPKNGPVAR
jgi:hypothetical protein